MKKSKINNQQLEDIFWVNAKDSLAHALDHFFEVTQGDSSTKKWHHQKWIILSVHHAASCLVGIWLKDASSNHPLFIGENGKEKYPHLDESIRSLRKFKGSTYLSSTEFELLNLLSRLNDIRNKFMHRRPPEKIDKQVIAYAATSMVGMLHVLGKKLGKTFEEIFGEFPENRQHVIELIHHSKIKEYSQFVEKLLADQNPQKWLPQCPNCGTHAIIHNYCEACFEEVYEMLCENCGNNFFTILSSPLPQPCPECGHEFKP